MDTARRLLPILMAAAALTVADASRADEPGVVATAPPASSIADQIDNYLATSPAAALPQDGPPGVTAGDEPRRAHGFVDVTVGSNGYRSAYVQSDLPVGKTGTLSIGVGESHANVRFGGYGGRYGGDRQSLGLALSLGGDAALDPRCRRPGEDRPDAHPAPRLEGGRPLACQAAGERTSPQ